MHRAILLGLRTVLLNKLVLVSGILLAHSLDFSFHSSDTFLGLLRHQGCFDDLLLKRAYLVVKSQLSLEVARFQLSARVSKFGDIIHDFCHVCQILAFAKLVDRDVFDFFY